MTASEWIKEQIEIEAEQQQEAAIEDAPALPLVSLMDLSVQKLRTPRFVIDNGQDYGDSRIHCCDVFYYDSKFIQQKIRAWDLTQEAAYKKAVAEWEKADRFIELY